MVKAILLCLFLAGIFVFLYNQGYLVINSKSAVSFIGSAKGNGASFSSCSGYMKRVVRFPATGTYTFLLDAELTKGDIAVELLDPARHAIMALDSVNRSASVTVDKGKKYYLVIHFKSATGRYALSRSEL